MSKLVVKKLGDTEFQIVFMDEELRTPGGEDDTIRGVELLTHDTCNGIRFESAASPDFMQYSNGSKVFYLRGCVKDHDLNSFSVPESLVDPFIRAIEEFGGTVAYPTGTECAEQAVEHSKESTSESSDNKLIRFCISVVLTRNKGGVIDMQNELTVTSALSEEEATGKCVKAALEKHKLYQVLCAGGIAIEEKE